jgi:hypothetical protein
MHTFMVTTKGGELFDSPRNIEITQGTIFTCAKAENYPNSSIFGMIITARCDVSQDKVPIFSYVPVVPLADWVFVDGAEIVISRYLADLINSISNALTSANLSTSLLRSKSPREILDVHFRPDNEGGRQWSLKCTSFEQLVQKYERANNVMSAGSFAERRAVLIESKKIFDGTLRELTANKLTGHYLLRKVPNPLSGVDVDCVALLREIHHIPTSVARRIAKGVSKVDWQSNNESSSCPHFVGSDDYCLPVARLKSPWIEHLMQSLTLLFSRIGVEDVDFLSVKQSLASVGMEWV